MIIARYADLEHALAKNYNKFLQITTLERH